MNPIKLEVELFEVQNGKIKKLRYKDTIIHVSSIEEKTELKPVEKLGGQISITPSKTVTTEPTGITPKPKKPTKHTLAKKDWSLGKPVGTAGHNTIFKNPLEWMKENIDIAPKDVMYHTFRKFYPGRKDNSIKTYISAYKRHIRGPTRSKRSLNSKYGKYGKVLGVYNGTVIHQKTVDLIEKTDKSRETIKNVIDNVYKGTKLSTRRTYSKAYYKYFRDGKPPLGRKSWIASPKRSGRKKPDNAVGKSKKYRTWIKRDEYLTVKRAINKWDFVATTNNIHDLTNMSKQRIRATIDYLLSKHEIYLKYDDAMPVYKPV